MPMFLSADIALEQAYGSHDLVVSLLFLTPQSASQILIFPSLQLTCLCPMGCSVFPWLPFNLSCSCVPHSTGASIQLWFLTQYHPRINIPFLQRLPFPNKFISCLLSHYDFLSSDYGLEGVDTMENRNTDLWKLSGLTISWWQGLWQKGKNVDQLAKKKIMEHTSKST